MYYSCHGLSSSCHGNVYFLKTSYSIFATHGTIFFRGTAERGLIWCKVPCLVMDFYSFYPPSLGILLSLASKSECLPNETPYTSFTEAGMPSLFGPVAKLLPGPALHQPWSSLSRHCLLLGTSGLRLLRPANLGVASDVCDVLVLRDVDQLLVHGHSNPVLAAEVVPGGG